MNRGHSSRPHPISNGMNEPTQQQPSSLTAEFETEKLPVGLPWRILVFSLFIFGLSIFLYVGLHFGYRSYLDTQSKKIDSELEKLSGTVQSEEREQFITFYSQIANLKTVLESHSFVSNAFRFLERTTISPVYYASAQFNALDSSLLVNGIATSYETLAQQVTILSRAKEIVSVGLGQVNLQDEKVSFQLTVVFDPSYLSKPSL